MVNGGKNEKMRRSTSGKFFTAFLVPMSEIIHVSHHKSFIPKGDFSIKLNSSDLEEFWKTANGNSKALSQTLTVINTTVQTAVSSPLQIL
ncbi:hypothetical protein T07_1508 [Trichinella nelsoni]|uniref:Uncharacterized protein n=1 Tax=Trichinella nelsoni TaxID=6336 RepID=A0A0V0SM07_9BILA|nr:hypothetical protein T07_1508 [Trichinella nelsoni]